MRPAAWWWLCVPAFALGTPACSVFDETLLADDAGTGTDTGSGRDAGPDATTADGGFDAACALSRPPVRPSTADGPDGPELVIALRHLTVDQGDGRWRTIGFDLDGLCTEPPELVAECVPRTASAMTPEDGVGGVDNALGQSLLEVLLIAYPEIPADINRTTDAGNGVIVMRVRGWNGEPDDPSVSVMLAQSRFATRALDDGGIPDASAAVIQEDGGGLPPPPVWDGRDAYWLAVDSFVDGDFDRPRVEVSAAYVANGTLVVPLPDGIEVLFLGRERGFFFRIIDAIFAVTLPTDGSTVPHAAVAARWPVTNVLDSLPLYGVCEGTEDYRRFERLADLTADVRTVPGSGGPDAVCDAISMGIAFDGVVARIAGIAAFRDDPTPCADAGP